MKVLVIMADDILINSSANLCHLAYIRGLVENGHEVDLICAESSAVKDNSMIISKKIRVITYDGVSLYEKLSPSNRASLNDFTLSSGSTVISEPTRFSIKGIVKRVKSHAKKTVRSVYGVYGFKKSFVKRAFQFRSDVIYNCVLSLSYPQTSHLLAYKLIKRKHIKTEKWIQIWEDPWNSDLYSRNDSKRIVNEENKLLSYAELICYVTPLTLKNQQKMYPQNSHKMFWLPLPAYYKNEEKKISSESNVVLGYFGDYFPYSRNLKPFYEAAAEMGLETYICGNPSNLFGETENVKILPRLSLSELKDFEEKANTLVFLCNLGGGQIPGKIYQYSATNKRIIFILDGTEEEQTVIYDYFSKFNRYYFCRNNVTSISEAIKKIIADEDNSIMNKPVEYFEPKNIVKELLEIDL